MPSKSKAQHRFMGAVLNCKKTGDCPSKKIREAADSMTTKEIMDFLKTKETHLPEKVSKASLISNLIKLANHLDKIGALSEADYLDKLIEAI
jgi:hypothetical protein